MLRDIGLTGLDWVVLGLHVLAPLTIAKQPAERRRVLLLALAAGLATLVLLRLVLATPEDAAQAGLVAGARPPLVGLILVAALLLADLVVWLGHDEVGKLGWWLLATFGLGATLAVAWLVEALARGEASTGVAVLATAVARTLFALAAAELFASELWNRQQRPVFAPLAGALATTLVWQSLPRVLQAALVERGIVAALAAAAILLVAAALVPLRLRRPAALAGITLAAIAFGATETTWRELRATASLTTTEVSL